MTLTTATALVLQALAGGFHHGFDVMDATGLASGTVYPILRRLEAEGFVRSTWEDATRAQREQRPPRRYYELSASGDALVGEAVARFPALRVAPARRVRRLKISAT
jgi:PadR family transcriptional regulator, regulatory protein PadR